MTRPLTEAQMRARFAALTEPLAGGHLRWNGPPQITWRGQHWRPAALAYWMRTKRHPDGYTRADCGLEGCVQPGHIDDATGRRASRMALRALLGITNQDTCSRGHNQTDHGRFRPDGIAYCEACRTQRRTDQPDTTTRKATS